MTNERATRTAWTKALRPKRFDEVMGQTGPCLAMQSAIRNDDPPPAWMLTGPWGTGKTTLARIAAKALNCQHATDGEPCNECDRCRNILNGSDPDVREMDAATNTGIDTIRELIRWAHSTPIQRGYRMVILDEAHMLSTAAANALLKTLEEPPETAVFILATTAGDELPATVRSRCHQLELRPPTISQVTEAVQKAGERQDSTISAEVAKCIVRATGPAMRDAVQSAELVARNGYGNDPERAEQLLGLAPRETLQPIWRAIMGARTATAIEALHTARGGGWDDFTIWSQMVAITEPAELATQPDWPSLITERIAQMGDCPWPHIISEMLIHELIGTIDEERASVG